MKSSIAALLALSACLSLVAALPSPAAYSQHPLSLPQTLPKPRWRVMSDSIIATIWGHPPRSEVLAPKGGGRNAQQLPAHTLARYVGDAVLRFNITTPEEASTLAEAAHLLQLDVWAFAADWVDIRLSEDIVKSLLGLLPESLQHAHKPLLRDRELAQAIWDTYPPPRGTDDLNPTAAPTARPHSSPALSLASRNEDTNLFFAHYQPLSVIEPWLRLLSSLFTTHVRLLNLGPSYQNRPIPALRVGVHPTNSDDPDPPKRKTILVMGGLHAREWISTSTVNYLAYSLITGYGKLPAITALLDTFDFVLIPTLNPDGYAYTWETDRLWRKNRQSTPLRFCQGIDLDHAFGFEWSGGSSSSNPCSESFAGSRAFEAVEAQRLAEWAKNETKRNKVEFVGFLDLHSYSQQILYPYSYSCAATPLGLENLEELAMGMEKAIRLAYGHGYEVLPACEGNAVATGNGKNQGKRVLPRIEQAGGSALDWFYHELRVPYTYQIKLRDRGAYGFLLPRGDIVPTGREILDAVVYFGEFLTRVYGVEGRGEEDGGEGGEGEDVGAVVGGEGGDAVVVGSEPKPYDGVGEGEEGDGEAWVWVDRGDDDADEESNWELRRRRRR